MPENENPNTLDNKGLDDIRSEQQPQLKQQPNNERDKNREQQPKQHPNNERDKNREQQQHPKQQPSNERDKNREQPKQQINKNKPAQDKPKRDDADAHQEWATEYDSSKEADMRLFAAAPEAEQESAAVIPENAPPRPLVGITIGDMNGIGIEVIIKTFADRRMLDHCTPIIYGSSRAISYHRKVLRSDDFAYHITNSVQKVKHGVCNIINCWNDEVPITIGRPNQRMGWFAMRALEAAATDLKAGYLTSLVTAPVNKNLVNSETESFVGHTEYLNEVCGVKESLMFLVSETLRVGLVTNHLPIKDVAANITSERILAKLRIMCQSLECDFGLVRPKIAVLALNPHAGDGGLIGSEEEDIIKPAINRAKQENLLAFGPFAADGFFGSALYRQFDAILAMYHDQGLVPFKSLSFGHGVNYTAGLPVVRTSPDHGTAYDIAGKNIASEESFRTAIFMALDIVKSRAHYTEMNANPLQRGLGERYQQYDEII